MNTGAEPRTIYDGLGTPWTSADLDAALRAAAAPDVIERFEQAFVCVAGLSGTAQFYGNARSALTAILRGLRSRARSVVVPAFCCPAVADAVRQAGRSPLLVDSGNELGSVALEQVQQAMNRRSVAAIVIPHLFGAAVDMRPILAEARAAGIAIVEDCAQSIGARIGGRAVGSLGDWSIFSFNLDKPFCLAGGGMLVRNASADALGSPLPRPPLGGDARREYEDLARFGEWLSQARDAALDERTLRFVGLRKRLPAVTETLRLLLAFARPRTVDMLEPLEVGRVRAALGAMFIGGLLPAVHQRTENFARLASRLAGVDGCELVRAPADVQPVWSRAKVYFPRGERYEVDAIGRRLRRAGFRAGQFHWPHSLDREPAGYGCEKMGDLRNATRLGALSLDLPIEERMRPPDVERMVDLLLEFGAALLRR